jgi:hypothetical protein
MPRFRKQLKNLRLSATGRRKMQISENNNIERVNGKNWDVLKYWKAVNPIQPRLTLFWTGSLRHDTQG